MARTGGVAKGNPMNHHASESRRSFLRVSALLGGGVVLGRGAGLPAGEDAKKEDFFGKPRSDRAQKFLSKILQH